MKARHVILAVDDNPAHLDVIRRILGAEYSLHCATAGAEALRLAHEHPPDLVLLDVMMPGLDGYETCRHFRLDPVLRRAKIILVSTRGMVEERLRADEAGADDTIAQPFEPAELEARVRVFLRLQHLEELDRMKRDLWTLIGQETRTPLASMLGALELISEEAGERATSLRELCTLAVGSMGRLRELLEKSQLLFELRGDGVEMAPQAIAVLPMLQRTSALSRERASRGDLEIRIEAPPETRVFADPDYLPMVLGYVLDYAIGMSPAGKPLDLIATESDGDSWVHVVHRGPAIRGDRLAALFEPLHAVDMDHHARGTGLGLALAREVAWRHGGDLTALSVSEQETRFTLRIPRSGAGMAPGSDPTQAGQAPRAA